MEEDPRCSHRAPPGSRHGRQRGEVSLDEPFERIGVAAAMVALGSFLVNEVYDLDVWWHVAIGRDILRNLTVPTVDRYAAAGLGRPYHDSHWLFQIAAALADAAGGMVGVQLLMLALWSLTLLVVFRHTRRFVSELPSALLLFAGALACVERFLPRPEVVTYSMVAVFSWLLARADRPSVRTSLALAVLQAAWTNAHGLFVLGPILVGCHLVVALSGGRWRDKGSTRAWAASAILVLAGSLASPYGVGGWRYAMLLLRESRGEGASVFGSLGELSPTFGPAFRHSPAFWAYSVLLVAVAGLLAIGLLRRRLSAEALVAALMAGLSLTGRRNVALLGMVAAPALARELARLGWAARVRGRRALAAACVVMLAAGGYALSGAYYVRMEIPSRFGLGATPSFFPHGVAPVLAGHRFTGTVLNSNTLGGFVLYQGFPDVLPLTDGRWEVYEPDVLATVLEGTRSSRGWRQVAARYDARAALIAHSSPEAEILPELLRAPDWRLVYLDAAASLWLRSDVPGPPALHLEDASVVPRPRRVEEGLLLDAFLARVGAAALRVGNLETTLTFGRRRGLILRELGLAQLQVGQHAHAEATFRVLLDEDPENVTALNELAFLEFRDENLDDALRLLERAHRVAPEDDGIEANLERLRQALRERDR